MRKEWMQNICLARKTRMDGRGNPQFDLLLGILNRVGTVADGTVKIEGKVASDSTWLFWLATRIL